MDYDILDEEVEPTDKPEDIEEDEEPIVVQVANPNHGELVEEEEEVQVEQEDNAEEHPGDDIM